MLTGPVIRDTASADVILPADQRLELLPEVARHSQVGPGSKLKNFLPAQEEACCIIQSAVVTPRL